MALALQALALAQMQATTQEARFRATADGLAGPEELPAGYHEFVVENESEQGYNVVVLRMLDGATQDAVVAAVEAVDRAFAGEGDPNEALNGVLEVAEIYGEIFADPQASGSVGVAFAPGQYLLVGSAETEEPAPEGGEPRENVYVTMTVTEEQSAQALEADQVVQMVDFAFALPAAIAAGEQTWQVVNSGQQLHHMVLLRLHEGVTMDDVMAWMETEEGPPPADEVGYVGITSPGISNWLTLDLQPGEYLAICFMPDHRGDATGQPHFMLGMMQNFTIAAE